MYNTFVNFVTHEFRNTHIFCVIKNDSILPSQNLMIVFFFRIFYDIEFGRVIDILQGHEDAVSCLAWSPKHQVIISGSWDCTVKVWHGYTSGSKIKPAECFIAQLDHDSKVTCINISR